MISQLKIYTKFKVKFYFKYKNIFEYFWGAENILYIFKFNLRSLWSILQWQFWEIPRRENSVIDSYCLIQKKSYDTTIISHFMMYNQKPHTLLKFWKKPPTWGSVSLFPLCLQQRYQLPFPLLRLPRSTMSWESVCKTLGSKKKRASPLIVS